jgi:two-component system, OmpR family, response regulator
MKATILVVDDMPQIRQIMTALLDRAGYNVITAATFEEGKQQADNADPDLMVVDVRLEDYNGLQLAIRERGGGSNRPVIVMSGHDDPVLVAEARRLGAEFLLKPFDRDQLLATIERMLATSTKRSEP